MRQAISLWWLNLHRALTKRKKRLVKQYSLRQQVHLPKKQHPQRTHNAVKKEKKAASLALSQPKPQAWVVFLNNVQLEVHTYYTHLKFMKRFSNLFLGSIFALLSAAMLFSCSKTTVEPEPADQVIGAYNGTTYTESINGVAQSLSLIHIFGAFVI